MVDMKRFLYMSLRYTPVLCLLFVTVGCGREEGPRRHVERLGDPSEAVRERAVDELGRMTDEAAPLLREAFTRAGSDETGAIIARGAGELLRGVRTLETLRTVAGRLRVEDEPNADIRLVAIRTVSAVAGVQRRLATGYLENALEDPDVRCVRAAVRGLADMHFAEATAVLEDCFAEGESVAAVFSARVLYELDRRAEAIEFLFEALSSDDPAIREVAAGSVVELGSSYDTGEEVLAMLFEYYDLIQEEEAAEAAVRDIRDILLGRAEGVLPPRRTQIVMKKLGMIADKKVSERLGTVVMSREESTFKRVAAAEALGYAAAASDRPVGSDPALQAEVVDLLHEIIEDRRADHQIRIAAAISLARLQQEKGVAFLLSRLGELDAENGPVADRDEMLALRISAQEAMEASGEFIAPYLLEALEDPHVGDTTRWAAVYTLGRLRERRAIPFLAEFVTAVADIAQHSQHPDDKDVVVQTAEGSFTLTLSRQTVLNSALGRDAAMPRYSSGIRIASAKGLGNYRDEAAARSALEESRDLHEGVRDGLMKFLNDGAYVDLVPGEILDRAQRTELRRSFRRIGEEIVSEQERVIFYIHRALAAEDTGYQE